MACAIRISDITPEQRKEIQKKLFMQRVVGFLKWFRDYGSKRKKAIYFYIVDKKNGIIHLPYTFAASLFQIIPNSNIKFDRVNIDFTGTLYPHQVPVEEEAWNQLQTYGTTTIGIYPGFGKTILGAALAARAKLLTIVLVHRDILCQQWKETFEKFTTASVWVVGEKHPPESVDAIICMDTRFSQIPEDMLNKIGTMLIDEAHVFCTPTHVECLLRIHPVYVIAESATLERDDKMHAMINAVCGLHGIFIYSTKPFNVFKVETGVKPERLSKSGPPDWSHLVKTTLYNKRRNKIIVSLVKANLKYKILILTCLVEHAKLLHRMIADEGIPCDYLAGSKKTHRDSRVLIGTTSKMGTGYDEATACTDFSGERINMVFLVSSFKKHSMLEQNVGRSFRAEKPNVVHFVDDDRIYKKHWNLASKWYQSRNGTIYQIDLSAYESEDIEDISSNSTFISSKENEELGKCNNLSLDDIDCGKMDVQEDSEEDKYISESSSSGHLENNNERAFKDSSDSTDEMDDDFEESDEFGLENRSSEDISSRSISLSKRDLSFSNLSRLEDCKQIPSKFTSTTTKVTELSSTTSSSTSSSSSSSSSSKRKLSHELSRYPRLPSRDISKTTLASFTVE